MKGVFRKRMTVLCVMLSMMITMLPVSGMYADSGANTVNIQVQQNPDIEVVLAAGASNTDVSKFAYDLQAELLSKYGIANNKVKISAVQTNEITTKDEFNWRVYDHYYGPTYPTNGTAPAGWPTDIPYFYYMEGEPEGSDYFTTVNPADINDQALSACYNRLKHIYTVGKDLLFVGYSVPAFKDFMLYPDTTSGKKKIEFTIQEGAIDTHTLEGAGFLFNSGITLDSNNVNRINGYLVIYDYIGAQYNSTGKYWYGKKINLYQLNNVDVNAFHNEKSYDIYDLRKNNSGVTLLASKNSQSTSTTLNIKIEATKNSLKLYEDSNVIYDTTTTDSAISMNDTGNYGFGPLVSYGSHACESLTYFTYKNITMTTETVKSFLDVIREPAWQDNTRKFIVNLDDNGVADFANGEKLAEILYRMLNLDLRYIGWGQNLTVEGVTPDILNKAQAENFIMNNNGKGIFIDQSAPETDTYAEGITAIADYIAESVQATASSYVLLDEPYNFVIDPAGLTGTWRIDHDPTYYPQNGGAVSWDNQTLTTFPTAFDKAGKYEVFYTDPATQTEQKIIDIFALWRPIAAFTYDPGTKKLTDASYDPNGTAITTEWKWKEAGDASWTDGEPDPSLFDAQSNYLVQLRVQNADGFWSLPSTLYITNSLSALPIASFTLPSAALNTETGPSTITPVNHSYHPSGSALDEYKWEVYDSKNSLILNYSVAEPVIDFVNLPSDAYAIRLSVRFGTYWSEVFTQTLNVIAPRLSISPNGCQTAKTSASTVVSVIGDPSDYSLLEYQWSTDATYPEGGTWTAFTSGDTISLSNVSGTYYLHIAAADKTTVYHITSNGFILNKAIAADSGYTAPAATGIMVERLSGADRYETAAAVSQAGWSKADTVVLARGDVYADALAGVTLAYQLDAPILLTPRDSLAKATQAEIQRLKASKAVILGGNGAISDSVAKELSALGLVVERVGGSDRFATAVQIAQKLKSQDTAVFVNGENFPDALCAASYAASKGYPILMVKTDNIPAPTINGMSNLGIRHAYIVGENQVISQTVCDQLPLPTRIGGTDRYQTALKLTEYFTPSATILFAATGLDFPDAITGAVLAAKNNSGIIYVPGNQPVPDSVKQYIKDKKVSKIKILGGSAVMNETVLQTLKNP